MPVPVTSLSSFMLWMVLSRLLCIVLICVTYCLFYAFYLHLLGSSVGWTLNYFPSFIFLTLVSLWCFPLTALEGIVPCRILLVVMFIYSSIIFIRTSTLWFFFNFLNPFLCKFIPNALTLPPLWSSLDSFIIVSSPHLSFLSQCIWNMISPLSFLLFSWFFSSDCPS